MSATIRKNTAGLDFIRAQVKIVKENYVKVGLLGQDAERSEGSLNNPTLGAVHELGSASSEPPVPRRSFIKEPLLSHLPKRLEQMGPEVWRKAILEKGALFALQVLGVEAENVIQGGFATGGYGRWQPLSPYTVEKKGSDAILIESAQMRKAIHSAVVKGKS